MTEHRIGTREQWLVARGELLERERELTRRSDELARRRQLFVHQLRFGPGGPAGPPRRHDESEAGAAG